MSPKPEGTRFNPIPAPKPGELDYILIGRLILAAVLLAVAVLTGAPIWLKIVLLVLSALASGYDLGLKAFDSVLAGDYFAVPIILLFVAFVSFLIGFGAEGAAMLLLYQLGLLAIDYVQKRTRKSAFELLSRQDPELQNQARELFLQEGADKLKMEGEALSAANFLLKLTMILALLAAFLLPLLGLTSGYKVSIHRALMILLISIPSSVIIAMPYTALTGLCFSARQGVLIRNAAALERTAQANVVVFDKAGVFSDAEPELLALDSPMLDRKTLLSFLAHAVYYSEQPFAVAVPQMEEQEYKLDVISDFVDLPGCGVELKIGGSPVILAKADYLAARGVQVPEAELEGECYYLTIAGRYVGVMSVSSPMHEDASDLLEGIKETGFRETILLTEDGAAESRRLGEELGMDEVFGECDTELKLKHIEELNQGSRNHVMFLYANGIEGHSAADVDIRLNRKAKYADLALAPENSAEIPFAIQISRRTCDVAKENAIGVFSVKALLLFLSLIGCSNIWFVMVIDTVAILASLLNAIRVTKAPLVDLSKLFPPKQD
jgi:Cd2+/Zn2+-exporting ATPase